MAILPVLVDEQRLEQGQADAADFVQLECRGRLAPQRVGIHAVSDLRARRLDRSRRVLDQVDLSCVERRVSHPHDHRLDGALDARHIVGMRNEVAAADVDVIGQTKRHRQVRNSLFQVGTEGHDPRDARPLAGRQDNDFIAGSGNARDNLARVAAKILAGTHDPLHRKAKIDEIGVTRHVHGFEVRQQRQAREPRHALAVDDDIVAAKRADRNERQIGKPEARGKSSVFVANALEHRLLEADQIHLVDRHHDAPHAQQRDDERVPLRLGLDALPRVDENDGQIRGRCAGRHVPRVLDVARRVGDDEAAPGRGEIAVRHVDRDAPLRAPP